MSWEIEPLDVNQNDYGDVYKYNYIYSQAYSMAQSILERIKLVSSQVPRQLINELGYERAANRLRFVDKFYRDFVDYAQSFDEDTFEQNETSIAVNMGNAVLHDGEHRIVIVSCYTFAMPYYDGSRYYIFADSKERIEAYFQSVIDNSRKKYGDYILMMTDTQNDLTQTVLPKDSSVGLDSVLLDEHVKTEIVRSVTSFFGENDEFYKKYNIPYRRGILLYGPPGNGKTTLIKAISNITTQPTVYWQVNEFTSSYSITQVFDHVKSIAPALLIIEDIDSLPESCRSMFLNYLDGTHDNRGVFLIGTTNFPDKIDPALMNRAGRFDRAYEIQPPTQEMREQYLRNKGLNTFVSDDDVKLAAKLMDKFSMSMLNELYTLCAFSHHYDGHVNVSRIVESLKHTRDKQKKGDWFRGGGSEVGFGR